ncbi:hypothetical protein ACLB1M_24030 [Escherichia coli]
MSILYEVASLHGALPDVDRTSVLMDRASMSLDLNSCIYRLTNDPYECDGLSVHPHASITGCSAKQMEQVHEIFCGLSSPACTVVTRGAGTGLSGGALPLEGVLLVMARFKYSSPH